MIKRTMGVAVVFVLGCQTTLTAGITNVTDVSSDYDGDNLQDLAVTGHFKTSHLGSPKNQPPQNVESKEHFFSNKLHISR